MADGHGHAHARPGSPARRAGLGAARGAAATVAMSAVQLAWQHGLGGGPLAPSVLTDGLLRRVGLRPPASRAGRAAVRAGSHLGHGAVLGASYPVVIGALVRFVPGTAGVPAPLAGAGYGLAVWALGYAGVAPAVGLLPPAPADRPGRQARLVASHLVFGAVLGQLSGRPGGPGGEHRSNGS